MTVTSKVSKIGMGSKTRKMVKPVQIQISKFGEKFENQMKSSVNRSISLINRCRSECSCGGGQNFDWIGVNWWQTTSWRWHTSRMPRPAAASIGGAGGSKSQRRHAWGPTAAAWGCQKPRPPRGRYPHCRGCLRGSWRPEPAPPTSFTHAPSLFSAVGERGPRGRDRRAQPPRFLPYVPSTRRER
jgi:hypothetical protein